MAPSTESYHCSASQIVRSMNDCPSTSAALITEVWNEPEIAAITDLVDFATLESCSTRKFKSTTFKIMVDHDRLGDIF